LRLFLGASLESGFEIVARHTGLVAEIDRANLIVTGEGSIDRQTYMGKGTGQIALLCRQRAKPCWGLAGVVETPPHAEPSTALFQRLGAIVPTLAPPAEAKVDAARWLASLAEKLAAEAD
jgi:glycerate kinase